ncbi:hypothetical protein [Curvivirga aplysinae]|uniref:hypothetical protein n=1 Tax=Curvivirga aplysinae TaxID=2529852 RepID=UPI0012BD1299|nr:hypothetical protein [Curvivirga aplysinae]MTI09270.1 hypothetical protein [Curvivirga aplysinae]
MMKKSLIVAISSIVFLSACTSDGDLTNILWRKATWESYVSGEDIKQNCRAENSNQYRYLYNANRAQSVLMYNWKKDGELSFQRLDRRIKLKKIEVSPTMHQTLLDPKEIKLDLNLQDRKALAELTKVDIQREGMEEGGKMTSADHFLSLASCVDGVFKLTVFDQSELQRAFPEGLEYLLSVSTDEQTRPKLPTEKATTNSFLMSKKNDEDVFNHYRIRYMGDKVEFGAGYLTK